MKKHLLPATVLAVVLALVLFAPTLVFPQQLQSGALLTIQSSDGTVNRAVYDSQIHSGNVQAPPAMGELSLTRMCCRADRRRVAMNRTRTR